MRNEISPRMKTNQSRILSFASRVILVISLCIGLGLTSLGHEKQSDDKFTDFWTQFKTAVINGNKAKVADLSKFPIGMSYGVRSIRNKAELLRRYREVFNQQTDAAKCFGTKEPERDETNPRKYAVACPDEAGNEVVIYEFERGQTGWKFVRLDNINE